VNNAGKPTSSNAWVLRTILTKDEREGIVEWDDNENELIALLTTILSSIYLSERKLSEEKLFACLKQLGIQHDTPHAIFGKLEDVISRFIKHGYLDKHRESGTEKEEITYVWGPRAKVEFEEHVPTYISMVRYIKFLVIVSFFPFFLKLFLIVRNGLLKIA